MKEEKRDWSSIIIYTLMCLCMVVMIILTSVAIFKSHKAFKQEATQTTIDLK